MQDVVVALVKRRAALAGEIEATYARLKVIVADLETIDGTITQFDPTYIVEAIRPKAFRPPEDWSNTTGRCPGWSFRSYDSRTRR